MEGEDLEGYAEKFIKDLVILTMYMLAGAAVFYTVERPSEIEMSQTTYDTIKSEKQALLNKLWTYANNATSKEEWLKLGATEIDGYANTLYSAHDRGITHELKTTNQWSFIASLFFCATVLTTIGYGNISPVTTFGRVFCIIFAFFGVPLLWLTVTDIEHWFSRNNLIQNNYNRFLRFCKSDKNISTKSFIQYVLVSVGFVLYISIGCGIFSSMENWHFFEAFYFYFITLSTIGLGDMVPNNVSLLIPYIFFIIAGLPLMTSCVNMGKQQYERLIKITQRRIKNILRKMWQIATCTSPSEESKNVYQNNISRSDDYSDKKENPSQNALLKQDETIV